MVLMEWIIELVAAVQRGDRSWRPFLIGAWVSAVVAVVVMVAVR